MLALPLALLSLLPVIKAQSTVSLFLPDFDSQSLVASIINADATATTYSINCANATSARGSLASASSSFSDNSDTGSDDSDVDSDDCGVPPGGVTQTQGPSTMALTVPYGSATAAISCQLSGTTRAVCTESQNHAAASAEASAGGAGSSFAADSAAAASTGISVSTLPDGSEVATLGPNDITFQPVVITAGAGKAQSPMKASGSQTTGSGISKATGTQTSKTTGSAATQATGSAATKATGAAVKLDAMGMVGGIGALAIGIAAAAL